MRKTIWVPALLLAATLAAPAQKVKVFLNNKPFKGQMIGAPTDLYLELPAALKLLGSDVTAEPSATEITLEGKPLKVENQNGVLMVRAKDLCEVYGGRYDFNKSVGSVDIYAYDPIASARASLQRILRQPRVTTQADFDVLTLLCRQHLIQQMGLKLIDDVELHFVNSAEMTKVSGRDLGTFVRYTQGRKGSGTGRYHFYIKSNESPVDTMHSLGWAWGVQWQNLNGNPDNDDLSHAFGDWVSYAMVRDVAKIDESGRSLRSQTMSEAAKNLFKELISTERQGGIEAVLGYIKHQAK